MGRAVSRCSHAQCSHLVFFWGGIQFYGHRVRSVAQPQPLRAVVARAHRGGDGGVPSCAPAPPRGFGAAPSTERLPGVCAPPRQPGHLPPTRGFHRIDPAPDRWALPCGRGRRWPAGRGGVRNGFSQSPERLPASISRRGAEPRQGSIRPLISRAPEPSVSLVGEMEGDGGPGLEGNKGDAHPQQPRGSGSARGGHPEGMGQLPVVLQARGHPSSSPTPRSGTFTPSARGVPRASVSPFGTGLIYSPREQRGCRWSREPRGAGVGPSRSLMFVMPPGLGLGDGSGSVGREAPEASWGLPSDVRCSQAPGVLCACPGLGMTTLGSPPWVGGMRSSRVLARSLPPVLHLSGGGDPGTEQLSPGAGAHGSGGEPPGLCVGERDQCHLLVLWVFWGHCHCCLGFPACGAHGELCPGPVARASPASPPAHGSVVWVCALRCAPVGPGGQEDGGWLQNLPKLPCNLLRFLGSKRSRRTKPS